VENNVTIPNKWVEVSKKICPDLRAGHMWHYSTITTSGYLFFYTFKAIRANKEIPVKFCWEEGEPETEATIAESIARALSLVVLDELFCSILPPKVFGTKDISMWADFWFKKVILMFVFCSVCLSRRYDHLMISIFRPHLLSQFKPKKAE
jgi:hypothetical protein